MRGGGGGRGRGGLLLLLLAAMDVVGRGVSWGIFGGEGGGDEFAVWFVGIGWGDILCQGWKVNYRWI